MTPQKIDQWLTEQGHDREWLAKQLGYSKGSIYNSFSKGFSKRTLAAIAKLMNPPSANQAGLEVTFTAAEFERIEHARDLLKMATRKEFYETAITEYADQIIASEGQQTSRATKNTLNQHSEDAIAMVAESGSNIVPMPERTQIHSYKSGAKRTKPKNGTED